MQVLRPICSWATPVANRFTGRPTCQCNHNAGRRRQGRWNRQKGSWRKFDARGKRLDSICRLVARRQDRHHRTRLGKSRKRQVEEEHKTFRFTPQGWLYDMYLLDLKGGEPTNLTAIDRVSIYNTGLFFWPDDPTKLGFQALVDGNSHPFKMDRNGKNKRDLTKDSKEFSYGFGVLPTVRRLPTTKTTRSMLRMPTGRNQNTSKPMQASTLTRNGRPMQTGCCFYRERRSIVTHTSSGRMGPVCVGSPADRATKASSSFSTSRIFMVAAAMSRFGHRTGNRSITRRRSRQISSCSGLLSTAKASN